MPQCQECNDTGVIETGNNDIPCNCKAGDHAIFNVSGEGPVTGSEIKRLDTLPQTLTKTGDRKEFGHDFRWYKRPGFWHSTSRKHVIVVPPSSLHESWLVIVPDDKTSYDFSGHNAERRAFAVAEGLTRQKSAA